MKGTAVYNTRTRHLYQCRTHEQVFYQPCWDSSFLNIDVFSRWYKVLIIILTLCQFLGPKTTDTFYKTCFFFNFPSTVCQPPYQPENGGYTCHPSPCQRLSHGTVIEFFCEEGYVLKGDYKYLTCQYGSWDSQMKLSCVMEQGKEPMSHLNY